MCFTKLLLSFFFFPPSLDWQQFFTVTTHGGVAPWLGEMNLRAGLCPGFLRGSPLGRGGWFASTPRGTLILTRQHCARGGTVASAVARTTERWITGCGNMERVRKQRERESLFGRAAVSYHRFVWILAGLKKKIAQITHLSRCPCARHCTSDRSHVNLAMPCMATATQWCVSGWIRGFEKRFCHC